MSLKRYVQRVWNVVFPTASPDELRSHLLREAQLNHLQAMATAEEHEVTAAYYREQASMLEARITRLEAPRV